MDDPIGEAASVGPVDVTSTTLPHVAVIGAGIGGLGGALALSRAGHRVTLLERDDTPMPESVEAAFDWDRRGAPQVRHSHGSAARLHQVLQARFPDVLAELRAAGAVEHDLGAMLPEGLRGDLDDLKVIAGADDLRVGPATLHVALASRRPSRRRRGRSPTDATTRAPASSGCNSMTGAASGPTR